MERYEDFPSAVIGLLCAAAKAHKVIGSMILERLRETSSARIMLAAALLVLSILVGQFSLSRLIPSFPEAVAQVRLLTLVVAFLAFWPELKRNARSLPSAPLGSLAALCAYLLVRGLFDGGEAAFAKSLDLVVFFGQGILVVLLAMLPLARRAAAATILACALSVLLPQIALQFTTATLMNVGFGWSGTMGSITLNRISFLAFCVVFCIQFRRFGNIAAYALTAVLATIFLVGTWGSLQKAAVVGSTIIIAGMLVAYAVRGRWRSALVLLLVTGAALTLAIALFGKNLSGRFNRLLEVSELSAGSSIVVATIGPTFGLLIPPGTGDANVVPASITSAPAGVTAPPANLTSLLSLKIRYCYFKSATVRDWTPGSPLLCYERSFVDATSRLPLWIEAVRGFVARPVFGNGLGTYQVVFIHPEKLTADFYKYPHNLLLEVAFEGGTVGLLLLAMALFLTVRAAFRGSAGAPIVVPVLGFSAFMAISVLLAGDFYDSRLFWLSLLLLASWRDGPDRADRAEQLIDRRSGWIETYR